MGIKKRWMALLLCAAMAVTVLGGCGKQENTKPASDSRDESASSADTEEGEDEQANKPQEEADKGSTEPVSPGN